MINTMKRDCRVLESFKIMDYSLLVGIHNLDLAAKEREESAGGGARSSSPVPVTKRDKLVAHSTAMESIQCTSDPVDIPSELPSGGIPARNHKGERLLLFVGIIDILQSYRLVKKIEHTFKAMIHDGVCLTGLTLSTILIAGHCLGTSAGLLRREVPQLHVGQDLQEDSIM